MQLFTFIYSKRTGTIAAKLPDPATHAEKAARMDRLLKLQDSIAFPMIAAMAGQTVKVLVEAAGRTPGTLNGRLDNNLGRRVPRRGKPDRPVRQCAPDRFPRRTAGGGTGRIKPVPNKIS